MSAILPIENKYSDPLKTEKINGVIYNMAGGTSKHAEAVSNLIIFLGAFFLRKHCKPFTSELDIHLDEDNTYRPDISVICDFSKMKEDGYHGAPEMVIEVLSPSTVKRDRVDKFNCYQMYGVKEYLLVNPEYLTIEQYVLTNGQFKLQAIRFNHEFNSTIFNDLVFNPNIIFEYRDESTAPALKSGACDEN